MDITNNYYKTKGYLGVLYKSIPIGRFYFDQQGTYFSGMELEEIRRQRLLELIRDRCNNVHAEFARRIGKDPSYINRCCYPPGKKGKKNIGDEIIKLATSAFNLPCGWFDCPPGTEIYQTDNQDLQAIFNMLMELPEDKRSTIRKTIDLVTELAKQNGK